MAAPGAFAPIEKLARRSSARIGDEDFDSAQLACCFIDCPGQRICVHDVGHQAKPLASRCDTFRGTLRDHIEHREVSAGMSQPERNHLADAASNEGGLAVKGSRQAHATYPSAG